MIQLEVTRIHTNLIENISINEFSLMAVCAPFLFILSWSVYRSPQYMPPLHLWSTKGLFYIVSQKKCSYYTVVHWKCIFYNGDLVRGKAPFTLVIMGQTFFTPVISIQGIFLYIGSHLRGFFFICSHLTRLL